jgi:peptide/nickel transport system permease protein
VKLLVRRLAELPPTILLITIAVFLLVKLAPGDPLAFMLSEQAPPAVVQATLARFRLDQPLPVQYWEWLRRTATGDLGLSLLTGQPVGNLIAERLPVTLSLAVVASVLSWLIAFPAGIISAVRRYSKTDHAVTVVSTVGVSVPDFVSGLFFMLVLAVWLRVLPSTGFVAPWEDVLDWARHIVLPAMTLAFVQTALLSRMVRAALLEVLVEDYVRTARSKGLAGQTVLIGHALRNALIPVTTTVVLNVAHLLGGSIIVEQIFAVPGMGRLLIDAVLRRDYPTIQGITLAMGLIYVLASFLADYAYVRLDPRVRLGAG